MNSGRKRIVVDSNVLVSAALFPDSPAALAYVAAALHGDLYASRDTLAEIEQVLMRPKFDRYLSLERRRQLLHDLRAAGEWFSLPALLQQSYSRDPDDDKFIHLALAARADWLISGDQDLLVLVPLPGVDILTPADALQQMRYRRRSLGLAGERMDAQRIVQR